MWYTASDVFRILGNTRRCWHDVIMLDRCYYGGYQLNCKIHRGDMASSDHNAFDNYCVVEISFDMFCKTKTRVRHKVVTLSVLCSFRATESLNSGHNFSDFCLQVLQSQNVNTIAVV